MREEFLWSEKYRPKKVADVILPDRLKNVFQAYVDQKNIPTLLLTGQSGVGKTTVALAMLEELNCDWIKLNGSLEGRLIDTLRNTVTDFASTVSFSDGRKYIVLDEADYINPQTVQPALRGFIEEFSDNCGFIFTCNYKNKILPALHSRCSIVEFKLSKEEAKECAGEFFKRVCEVLAKENIKFDKKVVASVIKKFYPDWRRVFNELQKYAVSGAIDTGILVDLREVSIKEVCEMLKRKDFKSLRTWVGENSDLDTATLFSSFYQHGQDFFRGKSIPLLVLLLAKYQYQSAFVVNQEINTMSFFVDVMTECEFI
jgi:DNA polymerase III delta prime subunit